MSEASGFGPYDHLHYTTLLRYRQAGTDYHFVSTLQTPTPLLFLPFPRKAAVIAHLLHTCVYTRANSHVANVDHPPDFWYFTYLPNSKEMSGGKTTRIRRLFDRSRLGRYVFATGHYTGSNDSVRACRACLALVSSYLPTRQAGGKFNF